MIDPRTASGLRDWPPSTAIPRERLLGLFRRVFASFGFMPIETPHIERKEVLTGKGAGSEEVLRQIFDVTNKGGTPGELALRFDLTVPLARFIAKHVDELRVPFKRYAVGSVFRGERPAKGRFREFTQCDFDTVGTESPLADLETVQVVFESLKAADIPPFTIALNHRKVLDGLLDTLGLSEQSAAVLRALDKLGKIGREGVLAELSRGPAIDASSATSPTSILPADQTWLNDPDVAAIEQPASRREARPEALGGPGLSVEQAERILDFVEQGRGGIDVLDKIPKTVRETETAQAGLKRLREVGDLLQAAGVADDAWKIDLGLARGLDYYTGLVLETTVNGWERYGSVCSGGRYDNLAGLFTTRRLPGVGASIGLDRLLALLSDAGGLKDCGTTAPILIVRFPGTTETALVGIAARLRRAGLGAEVYPDPTRLGDQFGYGSTRGHRLAVIVGPDEEKNGVFNLRDLTTRRETKAHPLSDLESIVRQAYRN